MRPLLSALLNQNPDHIPASYIVAKLRKKRRRRDVPRRFTIGGGLQRVVDAVGSRIAFKVDTAVASIQRQEIGFLVQTNRGEFLCTALVLAVPFSAATRIISSVSDISGLDEISDIRFSTEVVRRSRAKPGMEITAFEDGSVFSEIQFSTADSYLVRHSVKLQSEAQSKELLSAAVIESKINVMPSLAHSRQLPSITAAYYLGSWISGPSIEQCVQHSNAVFQSLLCTNTVLPK